MGETPVPWDDLQTFLAAARAGTLAAAADTLGTSPATVLRRLRGLEGALNASLFSRSPRGHALTPAGRELLEHVARMEAQAVAAQRRLGGRDQRLTGTIRIATLDDLVQTVLAPVITGFTRLHPAVCLDLIIDTAFADLERRAADVAIRAGFQPRAGNVIARQVCPIAIALYASREYLRGCAVRPSLESLAGHRLVRADEGRASLPMEQLLQPHAADASVVVRSNSMMARLAAVREGVGVGLLPCFIGDSEPALVRLGDPVRELNPALWILIHPDLRRNARVRAFVDYASEHLGAARDRLAGVL